MALTVCAFGTTDLLSVVLILAKLLFFCAVSALLILTCYLADRE